MSIKLPWADKYRPATVEGYVFQNEAQRRSVEEWIAAKNIPHLLFSGPAGTGKTTLAKLLIKQIGVEKHDAMEINASRERGIDEVRIRITNFVQTMPFGAFKVVLLDEAEAMTPPAQASLKGVMEMYAETARFILTTNHPNKIIPPLHSRCQGFHINKLDQNEFTARAAEIMLNENVEFDVDTLDSFVKATYPDLRKCLNLLEMHSAGGKLSRPGNNEGSVSDYMLTAVDLIKGGDIRKARQLICAQAREEDVDEIFRWMYDNLDLWSKTDEGKDAAIVTIRKGLVNNTLCADSEINLSATLIELSQIGA